MTLKPKLFKPKKTAGVREFNPRKSIDALYKTPDWENYRKRFLEHNPRCYSCGEFAQVVDHINPHKGDIIKFEALNNHLPLCHRCHNTCTALFDRHVVPLTEKKIKWLYTQRILKNITTRVKVLPSYRSR